MMEGAIRAHLRKRACFLGLDMFFVCENGFRRIGIGSRRGVVVAADRKQGDGQSFRMLAAQRRFARIASINHRIRDVFASGRWGIMSVKFGIDFGL